MLAAVLSGSVQGLAEVLKGVGAAGAPRGFQVISEASHRLQHGRVQRFQDVEGGE